MSQPYPLFSLEDVDPNFNEQSYVTDPEIMESIIAVRKAKSERKKKLVAAASVIGGAMTLLPHPAAKVVGLLLQTPDINDDYETVKANPSSVTDWTHLVADGVGLFPNYLLQIPGMIDDSYTAITGRDIIDDTRNELSSMVKRYKNIKDSENNKK